MKKLTSIYFVLITLNAYTQNLVPNPSFELYDTCPDWEGQIQRSNGWLNFGNTPDYFNSCASIIPPSFSIPFNISGYQQPFSGNAYAGLVSFEDSSNYKEFLGCQLSSPLIIGEKYFVSFRISAGYDGNVVHCVTNSIGCQFSTQPYSKYNSPPLTNTSIALTGTINGDTLGWTLVEGSFIADSAYNYLVIGDFFDDSSLTVLSIDSNLYCGIAYYFIDEVCVSTDSLTCELTDNISENIDSNHILVWPNPFENWIQIESSKIPYNVLLINSIGQIIYTKNNISNTLSKHVFENINKGYYNLNITYKNESKNYKLIKSK